PWLYLGFWIEGHPKMDYKRRFRPLQLRGADGWKTMLGP
ncbi:MAG: arginyltransferase, partial [Pseudomonadota bacterium]|nr:arginyltransferase [Pseudomonadota bacterium]